MWTAPDQNQRFCIQDQHDHGDQTYDHNDDHREGEGDDQHDDQNYRHMTYF